MKRTLNTIIFLFAAFTMAAQSEQSSGAPTNIVAVDLGLPSGTRWANMNVGASRPEEYGEYFAWGETEKKDTYDWSNYSHCDGSSETCRSLNGNICGTQYDVAHVRWGNNWRMPTLNEIEELVNNCTYTVTELNSVQVMKLTGPNGNSIYLPFSGYMKGTELTSIGYNSGYYWSGENPYADHIAPCMIPSAGGNTSYDNLWDKYLGLTVRPVMKAVPSVPRAYIDLGLPSGTKWANMNVGASRPEEYGKYFAWGETLEKGSYTWDNYMCPEATCGKSGDPVFDLVGDKADIAGTKFDAATINWGASWEMPTAKQIEELFFNCNSSLVTINGVVCRKLKSQINGNEIIFPLAGARWYESFAYEGTLGYYWSSTLRQGGYVSPGRFIVRENDHGWGWSMGGENDRFSAFPIRPVYVESNTSKDTISYHKFSVAFNDSGSSELFGSGITFQRNGNSDSYSLSIVDQQSSESTFDISKVAYITRKSTSQISLPEASELSENDITITVDGDTISVDNKRAYDATGSTLVATNKEGEVVYMNIASVEGDNDATGADLNAKESAITLMLPLVPNIFVAFDDEYLPYLKEMIWDVDEVKQLAAAIDRSVAKYGYTDFGEISKEATAAKNKISQLLHLDKLAERQAESASLARRMSMLRAAGSTESPYIINPYGYGGLQVEITDSEKKHFYYPHNISGYNCEVTAYNNNRFAYSSIVKGKYDAETNTYYIPDLGDDYDYYKNILKPQKVSTFMDTFTSFKYEDLERLGQFLEESLDLVQGDIGFGDMHWSDMKKTANFDISAQDDAIVLLFPRGNNYMLVYNIFQSIVKPIVKLMSKKLSKKLDSEVIIPVICGGMASDIDYIIELESTLDDPNLRFYEKIEKITSLTWTKFFKALDKSLQGDIDGAIKESFSDFVDNTVDKVGGYEAALDWAVVKKAFKYLEWVKKIGDLATGTLGTFFEDNAVYPIHWDANGQFVLEQDEVTVGKGESVNVRILVGNNSYSCESSDEKVATVTVSYNKIEIHGVDAGDAVITVKDINAQKTAKINVHVTGIQTFVLAESEVSVPMYKDHSVTIERGDGPFHIFGGDEKIAIAKLGGGRPKIFPGDKYAVVISGVSEGSTLFYVYNEATHQTLPLMVKVTAEEVVITDEQFVDLGLSVKWANCNVGANEPQEYGDYFAWGEVNTKDYYSRNNYKYYSNGNFIDIGSDISGTEYDAATHNMGNDCRMPTKAEYEELISKCEWKFVTYRRTRGWKVTGPSGNSIFLPVVGYMLDDWNDNISINGFYWSSSVTDNNREVYTLYTTMNDYKMSSSHMNRFEGRTVRAVTKTEDDTVQTETFTINGVSFKMIGVKGGSFMMGSPDDDKNANDDEKPQHLVTLSNYSIGQTEVTQALWEAIMGDNPSNHKGNNYPVEQVSREMCENFISKLNTLTGRTFRLPTEAEWEFAARGGKYSKGYKYAGSDDVGTVAWYDNNSNGETHSVAQKKANELGLYDMSGNVWELCQDYYDENYYSISPTINPCNTKKADVFTMRSGGPGSSSYFCRVAFRGDQVLLIDQKPVDSNWDIGLRLVLSDKDDKEVPAAAIDLGLPSGTKWASYNVGATKPEEFGGYYAWGETEEKDYYYWDNYMCEDDECGTTVDPIYVWNGNKLYADIAGSKFDIATSKWGPSWQMPSSTQMDELLNECIWTWCDGDNTKYNGTNVKGYIISSKVNNNQIFLPAAGNYYMDRTLYKNVYCLYWSSSQFDGDAFEGEAYYTNSNSAIGMGYKNKGTYVDLRYYGQTVRPVYVPTPPRQ
ncbi:MAG: formylglycine-generating enzyme family protein [Prevotella sp.]|nr:formylglycine-generating enzyme family protein [Prevotella sp.]